MKKSELRQLIKEEVKNVFLETEGSSVNIEKEKKIIKGVIERQCKKYNGGKQYNDGRIYLDGLEFIVNSTKDMIQVIFGVDGRVYWMDYYRSDIYYKMEKDSIKRVEEEWRPLVNNIVKELSLKKYGFKSVEGELNYEDKYVDLGFDIKL